MLEKLRCPAPQRLAFANRNDKQWAWCGMALGRPLALRTARQALNSPFEGWLGQFARPSRLALPTDCSSKPASTPAQHPAVACAVWLWSSSSTEPSYQGSVDRHIHA
eukprot:5031879-Alexandrium_andersonii.AAC.1